MKQKLFLALLSTLALSACSMDEWGLKDIVEGDSDDITPAQLQKLSKAIVRHPEKAEYLFARGRYYYYKDEYDKAINDFDRAIAIDANNEEWYRKRGDAYRYSNRYEKSLEDYSRAIKLDANDTILFTARGDCYLAMHQFEQAEKEYTRAIEISDAPGYELIQRASFFEETGRLDRAIEDYRKALTLKEDYWSGRARESLAKAYIYLGDSARALAVLEDFKFKKNSASSGTNADTILFDRAYLNEILGKKDEALITYRLALTAIDSEIADDDEPTADLYLRRMQIAKKAQVSNDEEERREYVKKILDCYAKEINSSDQDNRIEALKGRARFFEEENRPAEAQKDRQKLESIYEFLVKNAPENAENYHHRGLYFSDLKQHEKALADFRRAAALAPKDEDLQEHVVSELLEMKRFEEADRLAAKILEKQSDNETMLHTRAKVLIASGKADEALVLARQALTKDLYDADVHETIASIQRKKGLVKEAEASEFKARFYKGDYEK